MIRRKDSLRSRWTISLPVVGLLGSCCGPLLPAEATAARPLSLAADCARSGDLQLFRVRVPAAPLGGTPRDRLAARPAGESAGNLSLLHLDLWNEPVAKEHEAAAAGDPNLYRELQPIQEQQGKLYQENGRLQGRINFLEEEKKDPAKSLLPPEQLEKLLAEARGTMQKNQGQIEALNLEYQKKMEEINQRTATAPKRTRSKRKSAPAPDDVEVFGLYRRPGAASVELWALPGSGEEARLLASVSVTLAAKPPEEQETARLWARAYAFDLGRKILAAGEGGDVGFHRQTIERLAARFALRAEDLPVAIRHGMGGGDERFQPQADLYSITTGALAIEESLQLQRTIGGRADDGGPAVPLAELVGPKIKSHPFDSMLEGRAPKLFDTAALIPEGNWYAHFSSIGAEVRISDLLDQWGTGFLQSIEVSSRDRRLKEKLLGQLAVDLSVLTRLFGDLVIGDLAITGSDPYLQDGSDVALLLRVKNRSIFEAQMGRHREEAKKRRPDAKEGTETYQGVSVRSLVTPDRRVSSYSCDLGEFRICANSLAALKKVIDAHGGRAPRLSEAKDFLYMRSIFPGDPAQEDAFLYLSDPFIRNVVGPAQKIGRLRAGRCFANLRAVNFALLESRLEAAGGTASPLDTIEDLIARGYVDRERLHCPSGGRYHLQAGEAGLEAVCSRHNRPGLGTPLGEIPMESVSASEAQGYRQFVTNYEQYWTRYFDPVGIRFKVGAGPAGGLEAETCILPLIENSIYESVRQMAGGPPVPLSGAAGLHAIGGLSLKLPKEFLDQERRGLLRELAGPGGVLSQEELEAIVDQLGDSVTVTLHDGDLLFTLSDRDLLSTFRLGGGGGSEMASIGLLASAITLPTSVSVDVKDPAAARGLLDHLLARVETMANGNRARGGWRGREFGFTATALEPYRGVEVGLASLRFFFVNFHLHHAFIGKRLVVATQRWVITDLIDELEGAKAEKGGNSPRAGAPEPANLLLEIRPDAFERARAALGLVWQERMRDACFANFPAEELLLGGLAVEPARARAERERLLGYAPFCPAGGTYSFDRRTGLLSCSVHRGPHNPRQPLEARGDEPFIHFLESLKSLRASFRFTEEGIRTRVVIERKAGS